MQVESVSFKLNNYPILRSRSDIRDQLSARRIIISNSAAKLARRFSEEKYQSFLALCNRIEQKSVGEVSLLFTTPAEMFALDFTALTDEQITPKEGIVDFREIYEELFGALPLQSSPVIAPPFDLRQIEPRAPIEMEPAAIKPKKPAQVFSSFQYHGSSDTETFLHLGIEVNDAPALNFSGLEDPIIEDATGVVENCIRVRPPREEMRDHVILVSRSAFVRDGEKMVAFATSRYFDHFRDRKGNKERVTLLWGTMVGGEYRRLGLMVKLNYDLMKAARQAAQEKVKGVFQSIRRAWIKAPQVVRTQNRAVFEASQRYMKGVKRVGERHSARHQSIIAFIAQEYGWVLDESNVQRGAYPAMRVDNKENLIPGLGPRDAFVFAGDFTLGKGLKMWFDVKVLYPLRVWWRNAA